MARGVGRAKQTSSDIGIIWHLTLRYRAKCTHRSDRSSFGGALSGVEIITRNQNSVLGCKERGHFSRGFIEVV